jgi:hypothetical protein
MSSSIRLVATALATTVVLAACGESSDDRYRSEFPAIDRGLSALRSDVEQGLRDAGQTDDARLAGEFGGYARRLARLRARLDELDAPERLDDPHDELLAAAAAVRAALADVAAAAGRGDPAAARAAAVRLVRGGERLERARRAVARGR